ncbi:MAG: hypothetical protein WC359_11845 [Dehalococcoidia bacterium]
MRFPRGGEPQSLAGPPGCAAFPMPRPARPRVRRRARYGIPPRPLAGLTAARPDYGPGALAPPRSVAERAVHPVHYPAPAAERRAACFACPAVPAYPGAPAIPPRSGAPAAVIPVSLRASRAYHILFFPGEKRFPAFNCAASLCRPVLITFQERGESGDRSLSAPPPVHGLLNTAGSVPLPEMHFAAGSAVGVAPASGHRRVMRGRQSAPGRKA